MSKITRIPLLCLGMGTVGRELIRQLLGNGDTFARQAGLALTPVALANSKGALVRGSGFSEKRLRTILDLDSDGKQWNSLAEYQKLPFLDSVLRPGMIVIDATASPETGPFLLKSLDAGCGVVLANKIPLTGSWEKARRMIEHPNVRYECTVGAGLPVIESLQNLLAAGDEVVAIEGSLSGTLGYLCAKMEWGMSFSGAAIKAGKKGYTEPDPREDLSGKDVARKALILARTAGWPHKMGSLIVEPLFPESLSGISVEDFYAEATRLDERYKSKFEEAQREDKTWRYIATVTPQGGRVGLRSTNRNTPMGALHGPANYIAFYTRRYHDSPLIIAGPGAGPAVTAAGVVSDVIKLAKTTFDSREGGGMA